MAYGDDFTRKAFHSEAVGGPNLQKCFALIKPDAYMNIGKIVTVIEDAGFKVSNIKMTRLQAQEAQTLFNDKISASPFAQDYVQYLTSDVSVGIELIKNGGVQELLALAGPENSLAAKNSAPESLRARFGKDNLRNAVHASESAEHAFGELEYFFNQGKYLKCRNCPPSAILTNCSLLLIKPHVLQARQLGQVIDRLLSTGGFEISALQMFHLNKATACEFFEIYKGVSLEFNQLTDYVATGGPVVALEIRQEDAVQKLRKFCGPHNPEQARQYNANSLRA